MRRSMSGMTEILDETYDKAMITLKGTVMAYALLVCLCVKDGSGNERENKRRSRIALAANTGCVNMLNNFRGRR